MTVITNIKQDTQAFFLDEDNVWVCAHVDYEIEQDEVDTMREGEHDSYYQKVWQCNHCAAWQHVDYHWNGEALDPKTEDWVE